MPAALSSSRTCAERGKGSNNTTPGGAIHATALKSISSRSLKVDQQNRSCRWSRFMFLRAWLSRCGLSLVLPILEYRNPQRRLTQAPAQFAVDVLQQQ